MKTQSSGFDIQKAEWIRKHNPEHMLSDDGYKKHLKHHCNKYVCVVFFLVLTTLYNYYRVRRSDWFHGILFNIKSMHFHVCAGTLRFNTRVWNYLIITDLFSNLFCFFVCES